MATAKAFSAQGEATGSVELPASLFDQQVNEHGWDNAAWERVENVLVQVGQPRVRQRQPVPGIEVNQHAVDREQRMCRHEPRDQRVARRRQQRVR